MKVAIQLLEAVSQDHVLYTFGSHCLFRPRCKIVCLVRKEVDRHILPLSKSAGKKSHTGCDKCLMDNTGQWALDDVSERKHHTHNIRFPFPQPSKISWDNLLFLKMISEI
jgi:hypothetical protein